MTCQNSCSDALRVCRQSAAKRLFISSSVMAACCSPRCLAHPSTLCSCRPVSRAAVPPVSQKPFRFHRHLSGCVFGGPCRPGPAVVQEWVHESFYWCLLSGTYLGQRGSVLAPRPRRPILMLWVTLAQSLTPPPFYWPLIEL